MAIEKITLKEMEVREVNGEYEQHFYNEKTYPIFLTNYALKKGKEMGLIETSLFSELAKMGAMQGAVDENGEMDVTALESLDQDKILNMIYLALITSNRNIDLTYNDFLERFHYAMEDYIELYANLITGLVSADPNQFAGEFKRATDKTKKK